MTDIEEQIKVLKSYIEENINLKENIPDIPQIGMAVLQQQYVLAQSIEAWITSLKEKLKKTNGQEV